MSRLKGTCKGDCSRCELLAGGEVDMIPCVLDQIFQRLQRSEKAIAVIAEKIEAKNVFVSVEQEKTDEDEIQGNDRGCQG